MKRFSLIVLVAVALVALFAAPAYANFAIHGSYTTDTDACAGCHRAHTSFSPVARTDYWDGTTAEEGSALLVGSAQTMTEFCYVCHGEGAPGASTNVQAGVFDTGPSGASGVPVGTDLGDAVTLYQTESSFDTTLNGGGFDMLAGGTSMHDMNEAAVVDPMWGAGSSAPAGEFFSCTGCHDPHGSSNYRLLKDKLGDNVVGGYIDDNTPTPFVLSAETGYPTGGWVKHEPTGSYLPNYTAPKYRSSSPADIADGKGMSGWCAGCHEAYDDITSAYDYAQYEADPYGSALPADQVGSQTRHRHPVNITLEAGRAVLVDGVPTLTLATEVKLDDELPLELRYQKDPATGVKDFDDYLGCLTCHRAHGTDAEMSGYATARLVQNTNPSNPVEWVVQQDDSVGGVNPNFSSALLRTDNRGVCERCHNK